MVTTRAASAAPMPCATQHSGMLLSRLLTLDGGRRSRCSGTSKVWDEARHWVPDTISD